MSAIVQKRDAVQGEACCTTPTTPRRTSPPPTKSPPAPLRESPTPAPDQWADMAETIAQMEQRQTVQMYSLVQLTSAGMLHSLISATARLHTCLRGAIDQDLNLKLQDSNFWPTQRN